MITLLLSGGLGNQMFQYAAGLALARRLNTSVAVDLFSYNKKTRATHRRFELDVFETNLRFRSDWRNKVFIKYKLFLLKHRSLLNTLGIFSDQHALCYEPEFELLTDNTILSGYFQNEKYFKAIEPEIRRNFRFKHPLTDRNAALAEIISSVQSVSVHIRRGDYITDPTANLAVCGADYYSKAIRYIAERVSNPHFFVFSDDMEWVKEHISFDGFSAEFVDWNKEAGSYIDMQLMSLCKHNIIANSSFSWWGAWLNAHTGKMVLSPEQWFKNHNFYRERDEDYIPSDWIRIKM